MGSLVFTINGHMCCGVKESSLMVRVGPDAYAPALGEPHVVPMEIGGGRKPKAFVCVEPKGFVKETELVSWTRRGINFVKTLPPKVKKLALLATVRL